MLDEFKSRSIEALGDIGPSGRNLESVNVEQIVINMLYINHYKNNCQNFSCFFFLSAEVHVNLIFAWLYFDCAAFLEALGDNNGSSSSFCFHNQVSILVQIRRFLHRFQERS